MPAGGRRYAHAGGGARGPSGAWNSQANKCVHFGDRSSKAARVGRFPSSRLWFSARKDEVYRILPVGGRGRLHGPRGVPRDCFLRSPPVGLTLPAGSAPCCCTSAAFGNSLKSSRMVQTENTRAHKKKNARRSRCSATQPRSKCSPVYRLSRHVSFTAGRTG
jgi:hypothetical protein